MTFLYTEVYQRCYLPRDDTLTSDTTGKHTITKQIESPQRNALTSLLRENADSFDVENRLEEATVRRGNCSTARLTELVKKI